MNTGSLLAAIVSYFVIVDPLGLALIFQNLTEGKEQSYRTKMAFRAIIISLIVVLFFGFFGTFFLNQLGISMGSFRIAGGLLLFYTAFNMVMKPDDTHGEFDSSKAGDISVFPLSFPLIAGPGCLTLTILLFAKSRHNLADLTALVLVVIFIHIVTLFCMRASLILSRVMGPTVNQVFTRLLGVVLASLAIQFIGSGIKEMMG